MLNDTINVILEAEARADSMIKEAMEESKFMVANADAEADRIKLDIKKKVKEDRKSVVLQANEDGDKQYENIVLNGVKKIKELSNNTDRTIAVAYIKEKVLSRYGNS